MPARERRIHSRGTASIRLSVVPEHSFVQMWLVLSGDVPDANAAEVLEWKQMYDNTNRKIAGSFSRCAANGCFDSDVPNCGRSFRIGKKASYERISQSVAESDAQA